jgi:branched-chain amino acid transport system substrate-binding protein
MLPVQEAQAQDSIYVPLFTYRSGPFSGSGIPVANGLHDYLSMLNERDGGIGGVKLVIEECETGYDTKKGVECYESVKNKHPVMVNPWSTGITLQLIPKAGVDKIPVLSMAYGLSAAADGNVFPWIFNPPDTYWDGASVFVEYAGKVEGGLDKLKGKKLGLLYLDAPYGKEPIPLLQALAKKYGFELKLYPVPASEMQNQSSLWLNVRRDRPDWIFIQGWGAMNPTAIKEAARTGFKMDHLVGNWFSSNEDDVRPTGTAAKGFKGLNFNAVGHNFPAIHDILKYVVDKGKSQVASKDKVGENFYNRGVYNSMLIAEAIRNAQKITGKKVVTGEDVRRGLESLNIDEARLKEIGMAGFGSTVKVSCTDHSGENKIYIQNWDGQKWVKATDGIAPMRDVVRPLIDADAKDYAQKNTGWPKRTEPCDKSS